MNSNPLRQLAERLAAGSLGIEEFLAAASASTVADLGDAAIDLDRTRRCGFPEVVYGEGKTTQQLEKIFTTLIAAGIDVFATRISAEKAAVLTTSFPTGRYNPTARIFRIPLATSAAAQANTSAAPRQPGGKVVVVTAGTTDLPVAEEAFETAHWMGADVRLIQDVGVAGPQRLIARLPEIRGSAAVVCVAGMEAALPSVLGGHVDCPVIGVPTSVGYGASLGGMTALLSMLTSCAANVTVVNIDAGFKGGYLAGLIASRSRREP